MDMMQTLSQELSVPRGQIESAVRLMDEGNTIPFIARYRKEATGGLDDTVLRNLSERLSYLRNLGEAAAGGVRSGRGERQAGRQGAGAAARGAGEGADALRD